MCRYLSIAVVFMALVTGCSDTPSTQLGMQPDAQRPRFAAVSMAEDVALQQLLATLPQESHAHIRESFIRTPGRYAIVSFPNDPQRQALVDRVYAERRRAEASDYARRRLAARPSRVPVGVALVDRLPEAEARAVVLRRRDVEPNDVILLARESATGDHLAAAVASLLVVRKQAGQYPISDATISVKGDAPTAWAETELPRAERIVARLRDGQPRELAGIGTVPTVTLWLKAHR